MVELLNQEIKSLDSCPITQVSRSSALCNPSRLPVEGHECWDPVLRNIQALKLSDITAVQLFQVAMELGCQRSM